MLFAMSLSHAKRFFELSLDLFCVANDQGIFVALNPSWERTLGWTEEELMAKPFIEFVHLADREATDQKVKDLLSGKNVIQFKNRYRHKDGRWKTLSWRSTYDPETQYIFGCARDITAIQESSKLATLGEMASEIAHEINNPLAIICGKATQLREKLGTGQASTTLLEDGLRLMENAGMRIARIVRGLNSFSRSADSDPFEPASLRTIVQDTVVLCSERFKSKNIDFHVSTIPDIRMYCRPSQICQVLMNLFINSSDAIETLDEKWINLKIIEDGDQIRIFLTDSGWGIPDAIAQRMMDPFFTTKGVGKGIGLGLSIAKGIVEDHLGTIKYRRDSGHTQFVVEVPKQSISSSLKQEPQVLDLH